MKSGIRYQSSHEYARKDGDAFVVGISDHAQAELGDIVFVEFPAVGASIRKGDTFGVVESVKAASDLYMPLSGTILAVNDALTADPALVNRDPTGDGWMIRVAPSAIAEWDGLLDEAAYEAQAGKE
jgi:glycine cleavage system H protein